MKKTKKIIIYLIIAVILFTSLIWFNSGSDETTCHIESNQKDYQLRTDYIIYSKNNLVTKVVSKSVVESSNEEILKEMENSLNQQYQDLNNKYAGYNYKVTIKNNALYNDLTIDYKQFDMKKFVYDNGAMKDYINENKQYTLNGAIEYYKSIGATCDLRE